MRGHGETKLGLNQLAEGQKIESTLDADTLIDDTINIVKWAQNKFKESKLILVGHSMGGAIATKAAHRALKDNMKVHGLVVIDASENGTLKSVSYIEDFLKMRPRRL